MTKVVSLSEMMDQVGQEIGKSDWIQIDQDRIDKFADCTEDHQWIHVDKEKAAQGPFGKTIGHGFLTISLLPYFSSFASLVPEGTMMAINYGLNKVRLIQPVPVGSKIRDTISLKDVTDKGNGRILVTTGHTIEIEGSDKPVCVAETLSMFFTTPAS